MESLKDVGLLVLDDLGTERATEWAAQALFQIVNHRYSKRLPLVVTTNLSVEDARRMDARLVSRLLEGANQEGGWTRVLTMPCADFRRKAA
jgi:DNA replication protein DnaC